MTDINYIKECETEYNVKLLRIAEEIAQKSSVRLVLVAGPSCSGKTTTTHKLVSLLSQSGIHSGLISIDDFYRDVDESQGKRDFEALESIDVDLLHDCLKSLADGKKTDIPLFNFTKAKRDGIRESIQLSGSDIAIIEGLHALNPAIYKNFVSEDKIYRIFLDCVDKNPDPEFSKYPRLFRRLVRDSNFRNADAEKTFFLWQNVVKGEEKYIYPYSHEADAEINTHFRYELSVLKPFAQQLLSEVQGDSIYYIDAQKALRVLECEKDVTSPSLVPQDSMLREFIG